MPLPASTYQQQYGLVYSVEQWAAMSPEQRSAVQARADALRSEVEKSWDSTHKPIQLFTAGTATALAVAGGATALGYIGGSGATPVATMPPAIFPETAATVGGGAALPAGVTATLEKAATTLGAGAILKLFSPANTPTGTLAKENAMPGGLPNYIYPISTQDSGGFSLPGLSSLFSSDGGSVSTPSSSPFAAFTSPVALGIGVLLLAASFIFLRK